VTSGVEAVPTVGNTPPAEAITGGEAVYWALRAIGVRHVFGIVSIHNIPIFEAIDRLGGIAHISCRHEQSAAHAADGYARVTGELGVVIASTGPGTTNTATGLLEAAVASSPVLLITGQTPSDVLGKRKGYLHEYEQQLSMLRTLAPHAESVTAREETMRTILDVARRIMTGRPQPGAVEIPTDFQWAPATETSLQWVTPSPIAPDEPALDHAAEALDTARRPVIWAGGGVTIAGAGGALTDLAERLNAPVFLTNNARGAMPPGHPLCMGATSDLPQAWEIMGAADVMLAVGTRFQWGATANWQAPVPQRLIHLDVDPGVIGLNYEAEVAVVSDAMVGLQGLLDRISPRSADPDFRMLSLQRQAALKETLELQAGRDYLAVRDGIVRHLPDNAVIASDATMALQMFAQRLLPITRPRSSTTVTSGAIGPGLATALGAAIGSDAPTILIQGDGGLMMSIGELATISETHAQVIMLVFNDRGYGAIRMLESMSFGERAFATELQTPDFCVIAHAMGIGARRVGDSSEFDQAFAEAVADGGPYLLDIDLTKMRSTSPVEWMRRSQAMLEARFDRS
jgi:acetolactate synthase-1/2/3 large subunit